MKISLATLLAKEACAKQRARFRDLFGTEEITLTRELVLAHGDRFDLSWAAHNLLTPEQTDRYRSVVEPLTEAYNVAVAPIARAYDEASDVHWRAYITAKTPAWQAYNRGDMSRPNYALAEQPFWDAYKTAVSFLWEVRNAAIGPLLQAYKAAKLAAFADAADL